MFFGFLVEKGSKNDRKIDKKNDEKTSRREMQEKSKNLKKPKVFQGFFNFR